jgi:hypothetical protein
VAYENGNMFTNALSLVRISCERVLGLFSAPERGLEYALRDKADMLYGTLYKRVKYSLFFCWRIQGNASYVGSLVFNKVLSFYDDAALVNLPTALNLADYRHISIVICIKLKHSKRRWHQYVYVYNYARYAVRVWVQQKTRNAYISLVRFYKNCRHTMYYRYITTVLDLKKDWNEITITMEMNGVKEIFDHMHLYFGNVHRFYLNDRRIRPWVKNEILRPSFNTIFCNGIQRTISFEHGGKLCRRSGFDREKYFGQKVSGWLASFEIHSSILTKEDTNNKNCKLIHCTL